MLASAKIVKLCVMNDKKLEILAGLRASVEEMQSRIEDMYEALDRLERAFADDEQEVVAETADALEAAEAVETVEAAGVVGIAAAEEVAPAPEEAPVAEEAPAIVVEAPVVDETTVAEESPAIVVEAPVVDEAPAVEDIPLQETAPAAEEAPAFVDAMMDRYAWKTDIPGSPVRNILSAISLNDRLLFINTLFGEDPAAFQKTVSMFNSLGSLPEAEAYIRSHFPQWDMKSETVYRFMMAVRRKLL